MRKIAPDVERLMWLVAEERDPKAIADFEARFPELGPELAKRVAMVASLKSAGKQPRQIEIPRFQPRYKEISLSYRRALYVGGAALFAAIAFGSYAITVTMSKPSRAPLTVPMVKTEPVPDDPKEGIVYKPSPQPGPEQPVQTNPEPTVRPMAAWEKPFALKISNGKLVSVLQMICQKGGLQLEVAPGMPDEEISVDYADVNAVQILEDLGVKYGFTALDQGGGRVLVVPARDQNPSPVGPGGNQPQSSQSTSGN